MRFLFFRKILRSKKVFRGIWGERVFVAKHDTPTSSFHSVLLLQALHPHIPYFKPLHTRITRFPYLLPIHCHIIPVTSLKRPVPYVCRPIGNVVFACPVVGCAFPDYHIVNYYNRVKNMGVFIKLLIFRRLSQKIVASALICKSKH